MRTFYHIPTIPLMPTRMLLIVHMRLCGIRSRDWGTPTPRAWYYAMPYGALFTYHYEVVSEMRSRGFTPSPEWGDIQYMGRAHGYSRSYHSRPAPQSVYEDALRWTPKDDAEDIAKWRAEHGD